MTALNLKRIISAILCCLTLLPFTGCDDVETVVYTDFTYDYEPYDPIPINHTFGTQKNLRSSQIPRITPQLSVETSSKYIVLYDLTEGVILYEKDSDKKCYPASTTKLLACAVIMEYCDADITFTAGKELDMVQPHSSLARITEGCTVDRDALIQALLLPSGNDAAYIAAAQVGKIIARKPDLSAENAVSVFCETMNQLAAQIGAFDTHFCVPDGYHDDDHYTTAEDMLRIAVYARSIQEIRDIAATSHIRTQFIGGGTIDWNNTNSLIITESNYYYPYANGLKTGMTNMAGHCVVATAEYNGRELMAVVLGGQTSVGRWIDAIKLFNSGFEYILGDAFTPYLPDAMKP